MSYHRLLDGSAVSLSSCTRAERAFLDKLKSSSKRMSYFQLLERALGRGSIALGGAAYINPQVIESPVYLAARDIATRAGIAQRILLPYEQQLALDAARERHGYLFNVVQAAKHIGITKAAIYKAIDKGNLAALRIGSMTLITSRSVNAYKKQREKRAA